MNRFHALLAVAFACLGLSSIASAQVPTTYVKKAVFIRMHWDGAFFNHWSGNRPKGSPNMTVEQMNDMLQTYFNEARADYLNSPALHGIDLILLNDFPRDTGPMSDYLDPQPETGEGRFLAAMRARLQTGPVNKTTSQGVTYLLGRTVNVVFTWGYYGSSQGVTDTIGGLGNTDANIFITTSGGGFTDNNGFHPIGELLHAGVLEILEHELGHLLGGEHGSRNELADCPGGVQGGNHNEIMCSSGIPRERRFGSANFQRTLRQVKGTLQRCNSAFTSKNSCVNYVSSVVCGAILDYTQIQACIDAQVAANCQDICTTTQKSARRLINSLAPTLTSGVSAAGPAQL